MLSRYEKEKLIGSGTFGKVWLIRSQHSGHPYVLKEVQLKSMSSSEKQQAVTEVSVLARCRHRNIVRYKEACIELEKGTLSIVMEYADGGDLYNVIKRQKGCYFEEKDVLSWFVQITLALQYIHKRNILHRDLKSQNIFLTKEKLVKVGDFGIARVLTGDKELATTAIGTPYYLSPEICQRKPYNHKSDIWALGCVLFEMAALCHPFQAQNFHQLMSAILKVKHRSLPSYCSPLLRDLVSVLLHIDPGERPTADEILSIPALQPHIVAYLQSYSDCIEDLEKTPCTSQKSQRRGSLQETSNDSKDASNLKRRASVPSASRDEGKVKKSNEDEGKVLKVHVDKESISQKGRSNSSPRTSSVNTPRVKHTPLANIANLKSRNVQSRHSTPSCASSVSKKSAAAQFTSVGDQHRPGATYTVRKAASVSGGHVENSGETDGGYHSSEALKGKDASEKKNSSAKTSRSKSSQPLSEERSSLSSLSQSLPCDEEDAVFADDSVPSPRELKRCDSFPKKEDKTMMRRSSVPDSVVCPHELHCSRCVLDTLWKHRIRGASVPFSDSDKSSELRSQLQSVFGVEKFCRIYDALESEWEGNKNAVSLHSEVQSLDSVQIQYVPLFLQLVQINMLSKGNGPENDGQ